jgi:hypothetical protein
MDITIRITPALSEGEDWLFLRIPSEVLQVFKTPQQIGLSRKELSEYAPKEFTNLRRIARHMMRAMLGRWWPARMLVRPSTTRNNQKHHAMVELGEEFLSD